MGASTVPMPSRARYTSEWAKRIAPSSPPRSRSIHRRRNALDRLCVPNLDHAAVLAGRRHHLLPFPQVVRERLLDVDVLARLAGPDRRGHASGSAAAMTTASTFLSSKTSRGSRYAATFPPLSPAAFSSRSRCDWSASRERDDLGAGDLAEPADKLMATPAHASDGRDRTQPDDREIHGVVGATRPGACRASAAASPGVRPAVIEPFRKLRRGIEFIVICLLTMTWGASVGMDASGAGSQRAVLSPSAHTLKPSR